MLVVVGLCVDYYCIDGEWVDFLFLLVVVMLFVLVG